MKNHRPVLVTGAAGFIGSHVVEHLCERQYRVVGIDNFSDYYSPFQKKKNLQEIQTTWGDAITFYEGDIRDRTFVRKVIADYQFEAIFHLAAMPGVRASIRQPELYYDVNLRGTLILLDEIARLAESKVYEKPPKFVFASTSSVYGKTNIIPFTEEDPCSTPLAPYPATKRSAELLGYTYNHLHNIPFLAIRFFTVYGPRNRPDMMAYKLMESLYYGREVPLYNGGMMYRDWTYVGDIAKGVVAALDVDFTYEIVNLGRGEPILLLDFVKTLESLTGLKANLCPTRAPISDMQKTYASTQKAERLLNYKPTTSLEEGIKSLLTWYESEALSKPADNTPNIRGYSLKMSVR